MARTRDPAHVALPKIEIDETRHIRVNLKGRLFQDLEAYRAAYKEAYGLDVEIEALIPHILETYILADRHFRTWRTGQKTPPPEVADR